MSGIEQASVRAPSLPDWTKIGLVMVACDCSKELATRLLQVSLSDIEVLYCLTVFPVLQQ